MTKIKDDPLTLAHKEAVKKFREKYYAELDKTISTLIDIRDAESSKEITTKHKIDASVAIAKMLGSYSADKVTQATATSTARPVTKLTAEQEEELDLVVQNILNGRKTT